MSQPTGPVVPLVVSVEAVAEEAGIPLPLSVDVRGMLEREVRNAQADVQGYLGVPLTPMTAVAHGVQMDPLTGQWCLATEHDLIEIVSAVPETSGWGYVVTYTQGLDVANDPDLEPIRRYIRAHAINSPAVAAYWSSTIAGPGELQSVSAGDQSASFVRPTLGGGGQAGSGAPGALPAITSLDTWRRAVAVWQRA